MANGLWLSKKSAVFKDILQNYGNEICRNAIFLTIENFLYAI